MLNQIRNQTALNRLGTMINPRFIVTKPPNIIVKTESSENFKTVASILKNHLERDRYTIHHLTSTKFLQGSWKDSCSLLLFESEDGNFCQQVKTIIDSYVIKCDGRVVFYSTNSSTDTNNTMAKITTKFNSLISQKKIAVLEDNINQIKCDDLLFILRTMGIKCSDKIAYSNGVPENLLTDGYFMSLKGTKIDDLFVMNNENSIPGKDIILSFAKDSSAKKTTENEFVVFSDQDECVIREKADFNFNLYQSKLKTSKYGQNIIASKIINSTQTIFTGINVNAVSCDGLVVHAKRQLKGKGRTDNEWLSPPGCMMFSMQIEIPLDSFLGQSLSMVQHLVIVAFVKSIKQRGVGYRDLQLNIKWPNDIYIKGQTKIGGIIVNSSLWGKSFRVTIGLGVNISNEKPTACLNSLIRTHNTTNNGVLLCELEIEDVLAQTLNEIETLVVLFQNSGVSAFKEEYYKYWLHSGRIVTLESYNMKKAKVVGIDDFGYLVVKLLENDKNVTLQPDGNSFDMMKNLILIKS